MMSIAIETYLYILTK